MENKDYHSSEYRKGKERSLIMGREGGGRFSPYKKGDVRKYFSHAGGGGVGKSFEVVLTTDP